MLWISLVVWLEVLLSQAILRSGNDIVIRKAIPPPRPLFSEYCLMILRYGSFVSCSAAIKMMCYSMNPMIFWILTGGPETTVNSTVEYWCLCRWSGHVGWRSSFGGAIVEGIQLERWLVILLATINNNNNNVTLGRIPNDHFLALSEANSNCYLMVTDYVKKIALVIKTRSLFIEYRRKGNLYLRTKNLNGNEQSLKEILQGGSSWKEKVETSEACCEQMWNLSTPHHWTRSDANKRWFILWENNNNMLHSPSIH